MGIRISVVRAEVQHAKFFSGRDCGASTISMTNLMLQKYGEKNVTKDDIFFGESSNPLTTPFGPPLVAVREERLRKSLGVRRVKIKLSQNRDTS